jgi:hypothetical protein
MSTLHVICTKISSIIVLLQWQLAFPFFWDRAWQWHPLADRYNTEVGVERSRDAPIRGSFQYKRTTSD